MESSKRLILLLIAGVVVAFAAVAIRNRMAEAPVEEVKPATRVMIAKRELGAGTTIMIPQDADWLEQPDEILNKEGVVREDVTRMEEVQGAILRRNVHAGEPLELSMLTRPGGGGLMSAVLEPGMRAVSISVTPTSGNAGFVLPGDYVDLILTRELTRTVSNGAENEQRRVVHSKIFVENVRVLAADQMLDNPDNKAMIAKTITVEVTPQQSQMIAIAAEIGKIYMSLRALASDAKPSPAADPNAPVESPEQTKAKLMEVDSHSLTDTDFVDDPTGVSVSEQVKVLRPGEVQNLNFTRPNTAAKPAGASHE